MMLNREDFADIYSKMSDDELFSIRANRGSLVEEAVRALDDEIQRRKLSIPNNPVIPESLVATVDNGAKPTGASWWARLLIFLVWSSIGCAIVIAVYGTELNGGSLEEFTEATTKMFLESALALWGISQIFARHLTIRRTLVLATAVYSIGIAWFALTLRGSDTQQRKRDELAGEFNALGPSTRQFRERLSQIIEQDPKTFAEFQTQCDQMEDLLDSDAARVEQARALLNQMQGEVANSPKEASTFPLLERAFDDDSKVVAVLRDEIACGHVLSSSGTTQQSNFRRVCIVPVQDKISPLADDQQEVFRELQQQGIKLPSDLEENRK